MDTQDNEPKYVISVAARIVGIETHTLRYYEKTGLIQPYRSKGNIRYYSESDLDLLRHVKTLVSDLGVNPAGVEVVIRMAKKMAEMQRKIEKLESQSEQLRQDKTNIEKEDI